MEKKDNKKIIHNITSALLCLILVPVILINLTLIFKGFSSNDALPDVMGYRPVIVLSGSMEPTFDAGDMILLEPAKDPDNLQKDDIIAYLVGGKVTTHRIVQISELEGRKMYITKGDYNNIEDRIPVEPSQIQGVYNGKRIPSLGNIMMFMQSNMGIVVFLGVPFAGYILWDILKRRKDSNKKTAQLEAELAKLKAEQESRESDNKEEEVQDESSEA